MIYYYSASANGFSNVISNLPPDAVEISEELYTAMFDGQTIGKIITPGPDGYPMLVDPPEMTIEQLTAKVLSDRDKLLGLAAIRIAPLQDAVDLDDATPEDVALLKKWKQYRVALNRIQDQAGFPTEINWPVAPE